MIKDYCFSANGNRRVCLDDKFFDDFVPMKQLLQGVRISEALLYLMFEVKFSREEAEEYLEKLPEVDLTHKKIY